jgi:hypothetical protein
MTSEPTSPDAKNRTRLLIIVMKYLGAYLFGVLASVLFTPVEPVLVGKPLWPYYPLLAIIGFFLFYLYLPPQYVFGSGLAYVLLYSINLLSVVLGLAVHFGPLRRIRVLSPLLLGFPIGFVGTMGVYYTAAASI